MMEKDDTKMSILSLLSVQRGHFRYESGYHGEIWLDLNGLFLDPRLLAPYARELAGRLARSGIEMVVGPLVGGSFVAQMIATELGALFGYSEPRPSTEHEILYPVAYRLPTSLAPHLKGKRVAIVDDVVNAGSAVRGTFGALVEVGAKPVVAGALLVLGETALPHLAEHHMTLERLAELPNPLWQPASCPLCARGIPFGQSPRDDLGGA
jgi:orotate phosphoribosyltransferase